MITDPLFYFLAVIAVFLQGMAKGGFAGSMALLAIPLMSLSVPVFQAVAILLIPLIFMDFVTVFRYRSSWDWGIVRFIVPLTFIGVLIGTVLFKYISEDHIRVVIGLIALWFGLDYFIRGTIKDPKKPTKLGGYIWSTIGGFTSFSIHAGGLPISFYLLPQKLNRIVYAASTGLIFLFLNLFKIFPYYYLGQLSISNIYTALILLPLAPLGVYFGAYMVDKVGQNWFYKISYFCLIIAGSKFVYDGRNLLLT
ncbi:MAG: hypothetical protein CMD69_00895 [Gammaproteobacteria bacterium]|nr:hypothetical protein [Gammaproteobacteria bacterium]|tara:strand:- start:1837 stop:2592 length:756 start_codon:yes stop_codon:yes gene_type:complete